MLLVMTVGTEPDLLKQPSQDLARRHGLREIWSKGAAADLAPRIDWYGVALEPIPRPCLLTELEALDDRHRLPSRVVNSKSLVPPRSNTSR